MSDWPTGEKSLKEQEERERERETEGEFLLGANHESVYELGAITATQRHRAPVRLRNAFRG